MAVNPQEIETARKVVTDLHANFDIRISQSSIAIHQSMLNTSVVRNNCCKFAIEAPFCYIAVEAQPSIAATCKRYDPRPEACDPFLRGEVPPSMTACELERPDRLEQCRSVCSARLIGRVLSD